MINCNCKIKNSKQIKWFKRTSDQQERFFDHLFAVKMGENKDGKRKNYDS